MQLKIKGEIEKGQENCWGYQEDLGRGEEGRLIGSKYMKVMKE